MGIINRTRRQSKLLSWRTTEEHLSIPCFLPSSLGSESFWIVHQSNCVALVSFNTVSSWGAVVYSNICMVDSEEGVTGLQTTEQTWSCLESSVKTLRLVPLSQLLHAFCRKSLELHHGKVSQDKERTWNNSSFSCILARKPWLFFFPPRSFRMAALLKGHGFREQSFPGSVLCWF